MVAAAKIEREAVEKKNEQLRSQIKDNESLLASHQDQMAELKSVLQGMNAYKDDADTRTSLSTAPPSPAGPPQVQGSARNEPEVDPMAAIPCDPEEMVPGPSCNFPEILRLVCRVDLLAYEDFRELLILSRSSKPPSRAGSGSYGGLNVMSLAGFGYGASNSPNSSPTKGFTHSPNGSLSSQTGSHLPLKDTRFYKRVLLEDIEPTLRLDLAPGISWLARRTVLSSICEGTLVVEPVPNAVKRFDLPCTVCGERRQGFSNERTHRFRTSDSESAQRYSLCVQCLERIRSCCEFTSYLRLILDGHLRAGDVDEEKNIWDETVRLRERMFWSRIAGGIVPLVSRIHEPEHNNVVPDEHLDDRHLRSLNHSSIELQSKESGPTTEVGHNDADTNSARSIPEFNVTKPATPEPRNVGEEYEDSTPNIPPSRNSVDSEVSVYEEANADMDVQTAGSAVESPPRQEKDLNANADVPTPSGESGLAETSLDQEQSDNEVNANANVPSNPAEHAIQSPPSHEKMDIETSGPSSQEH